MLRSWAARRWAAAMMAVGVSVASPAEARSLLQVLFGNFGASQEEPQPAPVPVPPAAVEQPKPKSAPATFRTVCVRLCDGYYFPLSHGVSRSRFADDAAACSAQCQSDARLFYMAPDAEIDRAVDLDGRPYSRLPNAYRYRKSMDQACACRPAPWSTAEQKRHETYARAERDKNADAVEAPPPVAPIPVASKPKPRLIRQPVSPVVAQPAPPPPAPRVTVARGVFGGAPRPLDVVPARGVFGVSPRSGS